MRDMTGGPAYSASLVYPLLPALRQWAIHVTLRRGVLRHLVLLVWVEEPLVEL